MTFQKKAGGLNAACFEGGEAAHAICGRQLSGVALNSLADNIDAIDQTECGKLPHLAVLCCGSDMF